MGLDSREAARCTNRSTCVFVFTDVVASLGGCIDNREALCVNLSTYTTDLPRHLLASIIDNSDVSTRAQTLLHVNIAALALPSEDGIDDR